MGAVTSKLFSPIDLGLSLWKFYTTASIPVSTTRAIPAHYLARLIGGVGFAADLSLTECSRSSLTQVGHEKEASPKRGSLDHWWGFWGGLLAVNLPFSWFCGMSLFGLDTAIPLSIGTYYLFRIAAGARFEDLDDFDTNEAFRWRYVQQFGGWIAMSVVHGRRFWRPDLGKILVKGRGAHLNYQANFKTGPLGRFADATLGFLYRRLVPAPLKTFIKPLSDFRDVGIIKGFADDNVLKPIYGFGGRLLQILWISPYLVYQLGISLMIGMHGNYWGPHRIWKIFTYQSLGQPIRMKEGGQGPRAEIRAETVGLLLDLAGTLFWNPRYEQKHWEGDLIDSLDELQATKDSQEEQKIARHIFRGIFVRQMTDWWNPWGMDRGDQFYLYNEDYLKTFDESVRKLSEERMETLRRVIEIQEERERMGQLADYQKRGLILLKAIVEKKEWEGSLKWLNYGLAGSVH